MEKKIKGININYINYGNEKGESIVFLHGWGQNIQMMEPLGNNFVKDYNILIVDLPGFGKSEEPKDVWTVYDYCECIRELLKSLNIENPILVGHSFGGKISLVYASKYKVKKLVALASPFCKEQKKVPLKTKVYKFIKKVPVLNLLEPVVKKMVGSKDYQNASEMMRKILVCTVNTELYEDLPKIKCPTLLIWGTNDTAVPINRAYELEKIIKDAGVVKYEGATHYAYLERLYEVLKVLEVFFKD